MEKKVFILMFVILFLTNLGLVSIFAQESESQNTSVTKESQEAPAVTESQQTLTVTEPEVQWLWGEVVSVDTNTKQTIVKYLDYETDTEKEITIDVDDKTTYENIKSLDEIKTQDTLSIDYIISPDGKNIAKNISSEKNEGIQTMPEENKEEPMATPGLE